MTRAAILPALTALTLATMVTSVACSGSTTTLNPGTTDSGASDGGGGGDGGGADTAPAITLDQAATDAANAYCQAAQSCAPAYMSIAYGDTGTCAAALKAALLAELGASGATETPAQVEACAMALPQVSCGDLLGRKSTPACKTVPGTLAAGAACAADGQCAGTRCRVAPNQVCGTCTTLAPAGAACGVDGDCDYGLKCVSGGCVAYGDGNATCDATHPCRPDLGCKAGLCTTPSPAGTACADSTECDNLHGVFCNPQSKQCETIGFAAPSAACGLVSGHLVVCSGPGGVCAGVSAPTYTGSCTPPAATGAACNTTAGPGCSAGAVCVCGSAGDGGCAGTCTLPDPTTCH